MSLEENSGKFDAEIEGEKKKISELFREIKTGKDDKLNWMYKNPSEAVEREEYLLGRSVDKALDLLSGKEPSSSNELSNFPKRVVTEENVNNLCQVDIQKKVAEDPLFAMKQREIALRKQLLSNPVKVKEFKKMIEGEKKKIASLVEKQMRKEERRKMQEAKVNLLLLKELKKCSGKVDIKKLLDDSTESEESDGGDRATTSKRKQVSPETRGRHRSYKDTKTKKSDGAKEYYSRDKKNVRRRNDRSSDSESDERSRRQRHRRRSRSRSQPKSKSIEMRKKRRNRPSSTDSESNKKRKPRRARSSESEFDSQKRDRTESRVSRRNKRHKSEESSSSSDASTSSESDSSDSGSEKKRSRQVSKRKRDDSRGRRNDEEGRGRRGERDNDNDGKRKERSNLADSFEIDPLLKPYGLSTADGSKPDRSAKVVAPYKKKETEKEKAVYKRPEKLSENERAERLKEMMENAKWRKTERETNYKAYKEKKKREEKIDDYDDTFMTKQLSNLSRKGTMADRIKSNLNNIQRQKTSMDQL